MPHVYTARALPTACNVYRDGEPFALLTPRNMGKADYIAIMKFTEAMPDVIEALREALDDLKYLAMVGDSAYAKPDPETLAKALAALQAIGAL